MVAPVLSRLWTRQHRSKQRVAFEAVQVEDEAETDQFRLTLAYP